MNGQYDQLRNRFIETPLGPRAVTEKKWKEDTPNEHWAVVQCLNPDFGEEGMPTGDVVGHFLVQYSIARELASDGYEMDHQLDRTNLLWKKKKKCRPKPLLPKPSYYSSYE